MIESLRLGSRAKNQLVTLKRKTGIQNWNVLCRWAFVMSLREPSRPRQVNEGLEGGVEMTWRTFGGDHADIYEGLLKSRLQIDGIEVSSGELTQQLRRHIYRGIGYLAATNKVADIAELSSLVIEQRHPRTGQTNIR